LLKAHAILEKGNPPDQRAIYRSARRLALLFDSLGQSEEAIDFYQKAIAAGTEVEDVPYSDIGTMLNNVALILRKSGRQKAAEPCYLRALEIYEKQLGPDHADVASVLNNLAVFYTNERRYTEAEKATSSGTGDQRRTYNRVRSPISLSRNAIWRWSIILAVIMRRRRNSINPHSRAGNKSRINPRKITKLSCPIMPISYVPLDRCAKRINWRCAHARNWRG
jgi:tetratricopeptide (TPR) repeat protein